MASSTASESGGLLRWTRRSASICCASASVQLVQIEQRARHAVEQLDLLRVVQAVRSTADRARLGVGRHGIRVVVGFVIVVAEARQRRDRERRERSVDGTIDSRRRRDSFRRLPRAASPGAARRRGRDKPPRLGSSCDRIAATVFATSCSLAAMGSALRRRLKSAAVGATRRRGVDRGAVARRPGFAARRRFGLRGAGGYAREAAAHEPREHPCTPEAPSSACWSWRTPSLAFYPQ